MTPERQKPKKLANANNYDIGDIKSDDSTDDESAPKKRIPPWAQGMFLVDNLHEEMLNVSSNSPFDGIIISSKLLMKQTLDPGASLPAGGQKSWH